MEVYHYEGVKCSIMSGCYRHPLAPSILTNRRLDTTWKVLRVYDTAVIVAVSHGTSIPSGFSFCPVECFKIYETLRGAFLHFGVELSEFIVESDQGSGLVQFCHEHGAAHPFCLHHFLRTVDDPAFGVFVGYLIKSVTVAVTLPRLDS
jgi:hypothetical protein